MDKVKAENYGYSAGLAAQGVGRNPYPVNSECWKAWLDGYRAGYSK